MSAPRACALLAALPALLAAACALGPNYHRPPVKLPERYSAPLTGHGTTAAGAAIAPPAAWWGQFHDAQLARLIGEALHDNLDIQSAGERIAQARAERDVAAGAELPTVNGVGQYTRYQLPNVIQTDIDQAVTSAEKAAGPAASGAVAGSGLTLPTLPRYLNLYELGFDTRWELDIFGGTRRSIEAAEAQRRVAVAARRGAVVAILAELGNDYAQLRATQAREAIARRVLASERIVLELTQSRRANGLASDLDVAQARTAVDTAAAALPPLHAQALASIHALAVLTARLPEDLERELDAPSPVPLTLPTLPVGLPTALLTRRPDIVQAEWTLVAANARVGVAVAQRFPTVALSAGADLFSTHLNELVKNESLSWNLGVDLAAPIFEGGRLAANERAAKAAARQSALAYQKTVLQALAEVEDALQRYAADDAQAQSLVAAEAAAGHAWEIALEQYQRGLASYLQVLEARRSLDSLIEEVAQNEGQRAQDYIGIYKALGGGW